MNTNNKQSQKCREQTQNLLAKLRERREKAKDTSGYKPKNQGISESVSASNQIKQTNQKQQVLTNEYTKQQGMKQLPSRAVLNFLVVLDENDQFVIPGIQLNLHYKIHFQDCPHNSISISQETYNNRTIKTYLLNEIGKTLPTIKKTSIHADCDKCLSTFLSGYKYAVDKVELKEVSDIKTLTGEINNGVCIIQVPDNGLHLNQMALVDYWAIYCIGYVENVIVDESIKDVLNLIPTWFKGEISYKMSMPTLRFMDVESENSIDNEDLDGIINPLNEETLSDIPSHDTQVATENSHNQVNSEWGMEKRENVVASIYANKNFFISDSTNIFSPTKPPALLEYILSAGFPVWKQKLLSAPGTWFMFPTSDETGLECKALVLAKDDWLFTYNELFYLLLPMLCKICPKENFNLSIKLTDKDEIYFAAIVF